MSASFLPGTAGVLIAASLAATIVTVAVRAERQQPQTVDHYVRVRSAVPAMAGQMAQIYVRERATAAAHESRVLACTKGRAVRARRRDPSRSGIRSRPSAITAGWRTLPMPATTCSRWT